LFEGRKHFKSQGGSDSLITYLAERVCRLLEDGNTAGVVLVAPTGFGKTRASPLILRIARERDLASNLIHVVPTRALVREIYSEKFAQIRDFSVGYQSQDKLNKEGKSPFYLRDIVVTTLDSFLWNIYRIPVAEVSKVVKGKSQGHYHPVLSSIFTSIVVLDEAHIYLGGSENSWAFVTAVLYALSKYKVPFVIETATFPSELLSSVLKLAGVKNNVKVLYVCSGRGCNKQVENLANLGFNVDFVAPDKGYYCTARLKWSSEVIRWTDAIAKAKELSKGGRVLAVFNTVERAIRFYKQLNLQDKILIHGLMTERDRSSSYAVIGRGYKERCDEELTEGRGNVVVATQVIEVGVDVDADILISDMAPMENLVQRAGRLCRSVKRDRRCEPQILLIEPEGEFGHGIYDRDLVEKTYKNLREADNIDWRLLDTRRDAISYADVLEEIYAKEIVKKLEKGLNGFLLKVAKNYLSGEASPSKLIEFIDSSNAWEEFRSSYLVKLLIEGGDPSEDYITVNLSRLPRLRRCLQVEKDCVRIALVAVDEKGFQRVYYGICSKVIYEALLESVTRQRCLGYRKFIRELDDEIVNSLPEDLQGYVDFYVVAKKECYLEGLGLKAGDV